MTSDQRGIRLAVLVAALGYFVDIYDLLLFSILRVRSLIDLGVAAAGTAGGGPDVLTVGVRLINLQMAGMLVGGVLWGILADNFGRRSVLFGSIIMYSLANIANAFVQTVDQYAWLRFIAGIGLAGELGAGITLVAEIMSKEGRGWGTTLVASLGLLGAVAAGLVGDLFPWRTAYLIGGALGLSLLALRIGVRESTMFEQTKRTATNKGNLLLLFTDRSRLVRYFGIILVGVPLWYVMGILVTFSPELGQAIGLPSAPNPGRAVLFAYLGATVGDLVCGFLSQRYRSRRRAIATFLVCCIAGVVVYYLIGGRSFTMFYAACCLVGALSGYWAVLVTMAAEQFGTNLRGTVATTVPNFVRASLIPVTWLFQALKTPLGVANSAIAVGIVVFLTAFLALASLDETYGKDLDYVES
ncbi:MAG: MFS transporter [Gemmatimonadetes bacterium]|nr:MFS transporter [Gemmatimonadota bacterium]